MSASVTSAAIRTVRSTICRYTGVSISSLKFWKPYLWTISPLKSSSCHSDARKRTASDPRYAIRSQPTGPASSSDSCRRGRRQRYLATAASSTQGCSALDLRPGLHPLRVVHADVAAVVAAVLRRSRPVGHLVEVGLVVREVGLAVIRVRGQVTGLGVGRSLAVPLSHGGVRLG